MFNHFCLGALVFLLLLMGACRGWGQVVADSSLKAALLKGRLSLEGYVDVYYSYAFSHPVGGGGLMW